MTNQAQGVPHDFRGNEIAGAARELARMPSVAQPPLAGNGAHSVPASAATTTGCAHKFAGEEAQAAASRPPAVSAEPSEPASQARVSMLISPAIQHQGATVLDLENVVNRALAAGRVIERMSRVCPQREDCAGQAENREACRVYECDQCDFRGCACCMEIHESEPHWSDGDTSRERYARG